MLKNILIAFILGFNVTACTTALNATTRSSGLVSYGEPGETIKIGYDRGGVIYQYLFRVIDAKLYDKKFVINSNCISACTLYTKLYNTNQICATKRGWLWFHAPRNGNTQATSKSLKKYFMKQLPTHIQTIINERGGLPYRGWIKIKADKVLPKC
jgi:hypothetical protein